MLAFVKIVQDFEPSIQFLFNSYYRHRFCFNQTMGSMSHMFKELRPCYDNLISNRKMYEKRYQTGEFSESKIAVFGEP